jgi:HSP20 family protein
MTNVRWKRPFDGQVNNPVYNTPISGLFENIFGDAYLSREHAQFVPPVNLSEADGKYLVELSAAGFEKGDFKIELKERVLNISGKHQTEKDVKERTFSRKEFNYGSFHRSFSLAEEINEETIDAKYENGILKIALSKKEETKKETKEIKVS